MPTRKILYSPGYGAGWVTWNDAELSEFLLTYQPIIDFLEAGGEFTDEDTDYETTHPLLKQLQADCLEKFGKDCICVLGADQLKVAEVSGPVRIEEEDGNESYYTGTGDRWL